MCVCVCVCVCVCACVHRERYFKELVHMIKHKDISKVLGHPKLIGHQFWAADVATEGQKFLQAQFPSAIFS